MAPERIARFAAAAACVLASGCAGLRAGSTAEPLPNFSPVNAQLFRGGQPTMDGVRELARRGIRTVVDLRAEGHPTRRQEQALAESLGMRWVGLPMRAYWRPSAAQLRAFLRIARDPAQQPVFVHCRRGRDRVGVMVGAYHVAVDGWEPRRAYADARARGMTPLNPWLRHVIVHEAAHLQDPSTREGG